ncbi:MAG: M3 family oligoendopeptidase [Crocinitomicaceae bacterium]|nr:M3 family oligoendopeptidase [Crocinitomicaceae bacterium]MBT6030124.1 M3 family oligoendopeptidase [Crocinitomicaceae bacterium]MBT6513159.1 M3 family oligoendopeptidase [Crocinitomicaceae bacterium]
MSSISISIPTRAARKLLPEQLEITNWETLHPYFEELKERKINTLEDLESWLLDRSELEAVLEEDAGWRYIKMTIDTSNKELADAYAFFISEINPKTAPYEDAYNKKFLQSPYVNFLKGQEFEIYLRGIKKAIELFREDNISLFADIAKESQKYGSISGGQSIELDGQIVTMQEAAKELKSTDRARREMVFELMINRRLKDVEALDILFDSLRELRHKVAVNANYNNFRDYKFEAMGRFDYSIQDCFNFHDSIAEEIVPIVADFQKEKKIQLGYKELKPFDLDVDPSGNAPLKPFKNGEELLDKSIQLFYKIDPYFGECLETMREMGHLDLVSKKGKSPGGYNYPLYEVGVPFIFMNAVGTQRDLITMIHEGGHAVHSFLSRELKLTAFKSLPSEVAELASMSMELISMDHWDVFYADEMDLKRAKKDQLETLLKILPWVAIVDKFQHWIYTNPNHTQEQRLNQWNSINDSFSGGHIDWSDFEDAKSTSWHRQLHIFEVPFYYIEYGMAQLGAIAVWRNYKNNPQKAIEQYMAALKLGFTKSIPEIYATAGIKFDFSREYVKELADFVREELRKLN